MTGNDSLWLPVSVATLALIVIDLTIRVAALGVIPHNRRPSAALGWLVVVFFIPILGALVFALLGYSSLPRGRADKQRLCTTEGRAGHEHNEAAAPEAEHDLPGWALEAVRLNHTNGATALTSGNTIEAFEVYDQALEAMTDAVRGAVSTVHAEFFIFAADRSTDAFITELEAARQRGVTVRVLFDHLGSAGFPGYQDALDRLTDAGIEWRRMLPIRPWRGEYQRPDLRNHRKILVVDSSVAFTGSQNIIDSSYNKKKNRRKGLHWQDLMTRIEGPAVRGLEAVFAADWASETDELINLPEPSASPAGQEPARMQVLASGPGMAPESNLRLFNHLFYSARDRISVACPYFVPDESMLYALTSAVQRGVKVRLYVGSTSDKFTVYHAQRSYYQMLLETGVEIYLYPPDHVQHAKFVLIDDDVAVVASSNMDIRSFTLNLEVNLMVCDRNFVRELNAVEDDYRDRSHFLDLHTWLQRPLHQKYIDNACRLAADLQ